MALLVSALFLSCAECGTEKSWHMFLFADVPAIRDMYNRLKFGVLVVMAFRQSEEYVCLILILEDRQSWPEMAWFLQANR